MKSQLALKFTLAAASLVTMSAGAVTAARSAMPMIESLVHIVELLPTTIRPITSETVSQQDAELGAHAGKFAGGFVLALIGAGGVVAASRMGTKQQPSARSDLGLI